MRSLFNRLTAPNDTLNDVGLLVFRLWFGLVMAFSHGAGKLFGDSAKMVGNLEKMGFPAPEFMAFAAGLSEFVAALMLALGLLTRLAAIPMAITMLVAAFVVHGSDPFMKQEFALAYAVAAIGIGIAGPGRFSLDHLIRARLQR